MSKLPEIDFFTAMPYFVSHGEDVMVLPELPDGTIWQLAYDGWEWQVVAEHDPVEWLGMERIYRSFTYFVGDELLILNGDPAEPDFFVPQITVLAKTDGIFEVKDVVSLAPLLQDPEIFDVSINEIHPMEDLLILNVQVGIVNVGGGMHTFTFVRSEAGWALGPELDAGESNHNPLFTERVDGSLNLWALERLESDFDPPYTYWLREYNINDFGGEVLREYEFEDDTYWEPWRRFRSFESPDGSSVILYGTADMSPFYDPQADKIPLMELRRDSSGWTYAGEINGGILDLTDLHIQSLGDGYALMRRGDIAPSYGPNTPVLQHYHLLKFVEGEWQLIGDVPSHHLLTEYYYTEIYYLAGAERVTIFDVKAFYPTTRHARTYSAENFEPVLVPWFRHSETIDPFNERLDAFGFFSPQVSMDGWGMWMWHWNLGWLYVIERDENAFWFWNPALGWSYFNTSFFNMELGKAWLYLGSKLDYVWYELNSSNPRYFYSYRIGEWMSDTVPPLLDQAAVTESIDLIAAEIESQGLTVGVDFPGHMFTLSATETVEGKLVTVEVQAPFQYTTQTDYACQARFEIEFYNILVTIEGEEPVYVSPFELWTEAKKLVPTRIFIDFIFHTQESGIAFSSIEYNDGSVEGPIREAF